MATFDPTDAFHQPSIRFFETLAAQQRYIDGPAFVAVEVGCALARRLQSMVMGAQAATEILAHPRIRLHALDEQLLADALGLGMRVRLRGADALYAATAQATGTTLVSWDNELIQRAGAITPTDWLAANQ
jgi:predicted nucleic acid-binding protein